ncbi:MAG: hypothetical protein E6G60_05980 [Actinobacteria bacterium]|nr:MAG: hypothetical protein E6G60_05980 [Actinomycetota bacterium]
MGQGGPRAHRRDRGARQSRAHVHALAVGSRRPRRPGHRARPRPHARVRFARRALRTLLAPRARPHRRRRPRKPRPHALAGIRSAVRAQRRRDRRARPRRVDPRPRRSASRERRETPPGRTAEPDARAALLRHPHRPDEQPAVNGFSLQRAWTIARTDLRKLRQSRDFWLPLAIIASLFFVIIPAFLLGVITNVSDVKLVKQLGDLVGSLPQGLKSQVKGATAPVQASYALAVYLFAPIAIIVPLTVSSAVAANTIIGERERGSGEFLAHSPASEREIYLGKLTASLIPGYFVAAVGFAAYSIIVNLLVGPKLGGWFFPTTNWWILVLWVLPPFICVPHDLRPCVERGGGSTGVGARHAADHPRRRVHRRQRLVVRSEDPGVRHRRGRVDDRARRVVARYAHGETRATPRHGWVTAAPDRVLAGVSGRL